MLLRVGENVDLKWLLVRIQSKMQGATYTTFHSIQLVIELSESACLAEFGIIRHAKLPILLKKPAEISIALP